MQVWEMIMAAQEQAVANRQLLSPATKTVYGYSQGDTFPNAAGGDAAVVAHSTPQIERSWRIDWGSPKFIQDFQIINARLISFGDGSDNTVPWRVEGSNDLSSFAVLGAGTIAAFGSSPVVPVNGVYRYLDLWQNGLGYDGTGGRPDGYFVVDVWPITAEP